MASDLFETVKTADSIKDLFQISIITDEIIKGKLVSKQETYFIKHDEDFAKWYTDVVKAAHLAEYSNVKGCVILEPNGLKHYLEKLPNDVKVAFLRCSKEIVRIRMQERGDDPSVIEKRLLLDGDVFNKEVMSLADFVIDTSASNIYDNALEIYLLYKDYIKLLKMNDSEVNSMYNAIVMTIKEIFLVSI